MLARIQNDLFDLGAELCYPDETKDARGRLSVTDAQVERLEREIDELNRELQPLRSFVLPGGSPAASFLHLARTVSRRAERLMVALAARPNEPVGPPALRYINRLSDFLFVAARFANDKGNDRRAVGPGSEPIVRRACPSVHPLHDTNPLKSIDYQYVTVSLIVLNIAIYVIFQTGWVVPSTRRTSRPSP